MPEERRREVVVVARRSRRREPFDRGSDAAFVGTLACDLQRLEVKAAGAIRVAGFLGHVAELDRAARRTPRGTEPAADESRRLVAPSGLVDVAAAAPNEAEAVEGGRLDVGKRQLASDVERGTVQLGRAVRIAMADE